MSVLYIFSGLSGVGKSTIARLLAQRVDAVYLRVDTIETGLINGGIAKPDIKGLGYTVGYALAAENLALGRNVCADCVNPWKMTRDAWRASATDVGAEYLDIEVVCSNAEEHRRRVEGRPDTLAIHLRPTWQDVTSRDYRPHEKPVLTIDSSLFTTEEAVDLILNAKRP